MTGPRTDEVLSFLKLSLASLSATALPFLSGCLGEEEEDEGGEGDD